MPKLKTHQGTAKRISVTARKRLLRGRQLSGHLMAGKSPKRRRSLRARVEVERVDRPRVAALLPYR